MHHDRQTSSTPSQSGYDAVADSSPSYSPFWKNKPNLALAFDYPFSKSVTVPETPPWIPDNKTSVCIAIYSSSVNSFLNAQRRNPHICPCTKILWATSSICFSDNLSSPFSTQRVNSSSNIATISISFFSTYGSASLESDFTS